MQSLISPEPVLWLFLTEIMAIRFVIMSYMLWPNYRFLVIWLGRAQLNSFVVNDSCVQVATMDLSLSLSIVQQKLRVWFFFSSQIWREYSMFPFCAFHYANIWKEKRCVKKNSTHLPRKNRIPAAFVHYNLTSEILLELVLRIQFVFEFDVHTQLNHNLSR